MPKLALVAQESEVTIIDEEPIPTFSCELAGDPPLNQHIHGRGNGWKGQACQIQDAPRFEQAKLHSCKTPSEPPESVCIDIGAVYLESGDPRRGLTWLQRAGEGQEFQASKRDALLLQVYEQLGEVDQQSEVAWRLFRAGRSLRSLDRLLGVIGEDHRKAILADETAAILALPQLDMQNLSFLMDTKGQFYGSLIPWAEELEAEGRLLGATVVYRALLDSILASAHTKAYSQGARYWKNLGLLAQSISDWRSFWKHSSILSQA